MIFILNHIYRSGSRERRNDRKEKKEEKKNGKREWRKEGKENVSEKTDKENRIEIETEGVKTQIDIMIETEIERGTEIEIGIGIITEKEMKKGKQHFINVMLTLF